MNMGASPEPHGRQPLCALRPFSSHKTHEFSHVRDVDRGLPVPRAQLPLTSREIHLTQDQLRGHFQMNPKRKPSAVGAAKEIISSGRISGTPPTRVETTCKPAHAASSIAIPKDSVREVFMKMEPCWRTCTLVSKVDERPNQRCAYGRHVSVRNGSEQSDPILQEMGLAHLKEINHFRSVST